MANPYESYIRTLLWSAPSPEQEEEGESSCEEPPLVMTVVICTDNARSLSNEQSLTMKLLKPTVKSLDRWSSESELMESNPKKSVTRARRRSVDDLRSLMINNSKPPRSTDHDPNRSSGGLLGVVQSTGSFKRCSSLDTDVHPQKNDRWESKGPAQPQRRGSGLNRPPQHSNPLVEGVSTKISSHRLQNNPFVDIRIPQRQLSGERPISRPLALPERKLSGEGMISRPLALPERKLSQECPRRTASLPKAA